MGRAAQRTPVGLGAQTQAARMSLVPGPPRGTRSGGVPAPRPPRAPGRRSAAGSPRGGTSHGGADPGRRAGSRPARPSTRPRRSTGYRPRSPGPRKPAADRRTTRPGRPARRVRAATNLRPAENVCPADSPRAAPRVLAAPRVGVDSRVGRLLPTMGPRWPTTCSGAPQDLGPQVAAAGLWPPFAGRRARDLSAPPSRGRPSSRAHRPPVVVARRAGRRGPGLERGGRPTLDGGADQTAACTPPGRAGS